MGGVNTLALLRGIPLDRPKPDDLGVVGSSGVGDSGFNTKAADMGHDTCRRRIIGMQAGEDGRPEWQVGFGDLSALGDVFDDRPASFHDGETGEFLWVGVVTAEHLAANTDQLRLIEVTRRKKGDGQFFIRNVRDIFVKSLGEGSIVATSPVNGGCRNLSRGGQPMILQLQQKR